MQPPRIAYKEISLLSECADFLSAAFLGGAVELLDDPDALPQATAAPAQTSVTRAVGARPATLRLTAGPVVVRLACRRSGVRCRPRPCR